MTGPLLASLDELRSALETLLAALDAPPAPGEVDGALAAARRRCEGAFERVRACREEALARGEEPSAEVRARAADVLRLEAVAASLAGRAQDAAREGIESVQRTRRSLRDALGRAATPASCDVRG